MAKDALMTADQIGREPDIRRVENKFGIENIVGVDDSHTEIHILTVIPDHHAIEDIQSIIFDGEGIQDIL